MTSQPPEPVVCVSYLANAALWSVPAFPKANHGAEVRSIEHSIAADGPMTAGVLAALEIPTLLLANTIGTDAAGDAVHSWLQRTRVQIARPQVDGVTTPQITVVADDRGTRTWFPYLPGVAADLAELDLTPLVDASFAYIDCYQLIEGPAVRAIQSLPLLVPPFARLGRVLV